MQFLVYLVLLTVSVSTVLLEVHWLTSPAPQPRPIAQASSPPVSKNEGSNAALRPVYQQKPDAPRSANVQTEITSAAAPQPTGQDAPASPIVPTAPTTPAEVSPTTQSPAAQQPGTEQPLQRPAAAPQSHQAALPQAPTSGSSETNEGSREKSSAEFTGVAALGEDNTRQATAGPPGSMNRVDNPRRTSQGSSSSCDVQACAKAYRSFRATDCTYQPLDGQRRFCEQPRGQQMAREQSEQRERRRWNREADAHSLDRSTMGRRLNDDEDHDDFEDSDRGPLGFFLFGRRPRW